MDTWIKRDGVLRFGGAIATQEQLQDQIDDGRAQVVEYEQTVEEAIADKLEELEAYCDGKRAEDYEYKNNFYAQDLEFKQNVLGIVMGGQIYEALNGSGTYRQKITNIAGHRIEFTLIEAIEIGLEISGKIDSYEDRLETQTALIKNKNTVQEVLDHDFTL